MTGLIKTIVNKACTYGSVFIIVSFCITCCKPSAPTNAVGTTANPITASCNFDAGSIDTLYETKPGVLTGRPKHWKQKTSADDQYYWFYFKLNNVADRLVTVILDSLSGVYRGGPHLIYTKGTQPVFSYDQKNWQRITDVVYDEDLHTLSFKNKFTANEVWIAYAHPYSFQQGQSFIKSVSGNPFLSIENLGRSHESREIQLLTITDPSVADNEKKMVFITTLQHAGEFSGGYVMEGLITFLLSDNEQAGIARKNIIFKLIPMMNPDGIFHGMTRFNANYEDLNQEWDDDFTDSIHLPLEPEVACVKQWLRKCKSAGQQINLGLDIHSQGQEGVMNLLHTPNNTLPNLTQHLAKYWPVEYIPMEFSGSLNNCLAREFQVPSGTLEIPQSRIGNAAYLTIADYLNYGSGIALGITSYFLNTDE